MASGDLDQIGTAPGGVCGTFKAFSSLGDVFFFGCRHQADQPDAVLKADTLSGNACVWLCLSKLEMSAEHPMRWGQKFMSLGCSKLQGKNLGTLISL